MLNLGAKTSDPVEFAMVEQGTAVPGGGTISLGNDTAEFGPNEVFGYQ